MPTHECIGIYAGAIFACFILCGCVGESRGLDKIIEKRIFRFESLFIIAEFIYRLDADFDDR